MLGACTALEPADKFQEAIPGAETVAVRIASPATRVGFDDNLGKFSWTAGDKIAVHVSATAQIAGSYKTATVAVDPIDDAIGNFSVVLSGGQERNLFAVYPDVSAVSTAAAADGFKVCLPAERPISGSMADSPVPMVALNATSPLTFQHVGALLRLELKNVPTGTKKIAVSMGKRITGEFAVAGISDAGLDNPSIATEDGSDEVVFVLPEALTSYVSDFILNVPLPTGTYPSLRITARDAADEPIHSYYDEVERSFDAGRGRHAEAQLSNLTTPLCLEAAEIASVVISNPLGLTIELSSDAITWTSMTDERKEIWLGIGDKLYFRGNNTNYANGTSENSLYTNIRCDGRCYLYGNIMSLIQAIGFDEVTSLTNSFTFVSLFSHSNILNKTGEELLLPATTLSNSCYENMFAECATLTAAPELPAVSLPYGAYQRMFYHCEALGKAPRALPATTLNSYCYCEMFAKCPSLTTIPEVLPALNASYGSYKGMFQDCVSLTGTPVIEATVLGQDCFMNMFSGCSNLTSAQELKATKMGSGCYRSMFEGCTSLVSAPQIDANVLANSCFSQMFKGCTALTVPPELNVMDLAQYCYYSMFQGCTSLTKAPNLPAKILQPYCYQQMFHSCTSLLETPDEMNPETTASSCCSSMFEDCTSLASTMEELSAKVLSTSCYARMFYHCSSLEVGPRLPAKNLVNSCYTYMFLGSAVNKIEAYFTSTPNTLYMDRWLDNLLTTTGDIYLNSAITSLWNPANYRTASGIPAGWEIHYVTVQD